MHREALLIANPIAGRGLSAGLASKLKALAPKYGIHIQVALTQGPGHATEIAAKAAQEGSLVVIALGGDGTVNEVATGIVDTPTQLGIIPAGSGNGLARHLRISMRPTVALQQIALGRSVRMDAGIINGRYFFVTAGVGLDGAVAHTFADLPGRGLATYAKSVTQVLGARKLFTAQFSGLIGSHHSPGQYEMISWANASQYGNNAFLSANSDIQDGMLEMVQISRATKGTYGLMMAGLFTRSLDMIPEVTLSKITSAELAISSGPCPMHLDGEPAGYVENVIISLKPLCLNVLCGG